MKGFFACPLASGENLEKSQRIVSFIKSMGHHILNKHVSVSREERDRVFSEMSGVPIGDVDKFVTRKQDLMWILKTEFMVLDFTHGSWGGGIEFHHATVVRKLLGMHDIPILCLKERDKRGSWLIEGIDSEEFPKVLIQEYSGFTEIEETIREFLNFLNT